MKGRNSGLGIGKITNWFPRILLATITFPFDEILETQTGNNTGVEDWFHFVFKVVVHQIWWWWKRWRLGGIRNEGKYLRNMKNISRKTPSRRKFKSVINRRDLHDYFKRTKTFVIQFAGWASGTEIGCIQEDLIPNLIKRSRVVMMIIKPLHSGGGVM